MHACTPAKAMRAARSAAAPARPACPRPGIARPRRIATAAAGTDHEAPTVLDLITQTRAWKRLNELVEEHRLEREDVISLIHSSPMAGVLDALTCPATSAQMAQDPSLRATVEGAVRSFDSTLSEDDIAWMAKLMKHVNDGAAQGATDVWGEALSEFPHAPSPGAAELLAAARNFWTQERVDSFLGEAQSSISPVSAAVVRDMLRRLRDANGARAAALQTIDILELAMGPAEVWAVAEGIGADADHPLDWFDSLDATFVDDLRTNKLSPC
ncbi:hypothetical protein Rsub_07277 [Raphidocelis subcapitata]|uniref:Uncharacterized protein n=1 Tax=Raphidocelis subcapitata TaxID=307507 RepID=A0A2V0P349_9CHLO|nr:hypothetical protein Rsub_07277 [Raphidocelis subcapitata]|eukprot:GBF94009.1 hypothetical protein Rsub_07277 [Raphidocelis subcapitata]